MVFGKLPKMDNEKIIKYLTDMQFSVDSMLKNSKNIDVLKFYAGKISILNGEIMSILLQTE